MATITQYIKETKAEMAHVTWPTRQQAIYFTVAVIVISVVVAYYLGAFDSLFKVGLERLLNN